MRSLTMADGAIACAFQRRRGKLGVVGFDLLQADNVRTRVGEPVQSLGRRPLTPFTL